MQDQTYEFQAEWERRVMMDEEIATLRAQLAEVTRERDGYMSEIQRAPVDAGRADVLLASNQLQEE